MRAAVFAPLALVIAAAAHAQVEISTIAVPIRASLQPVLPLVEAQVPRTYDDSRRNTGFTVRSHVVRDPIRLQMAGPNLNATTIARYSLEACRGRLGCLGCGTEGEALRVATISLSAQFSWDANWRLHSTTSAQPATFPNRCQITVFNFDITDHFIAPLVEQQLRAAATAIDRNTPGLTNIRPNAEGIWKGLQEPVEIAPRTWLIFEPLDAGLSPLTGQNMDVATTLSMNARTRVIVGDKPAAAKTPLPALQSRTLPGGLRVPFTLHIPYADASAMANSEFAGRTHKVGTDDLRIDSIRIVPGAGGKLGVDATIDYRGGAFKRYSGPVHLEGTPKLGASSVVTIPDLDYVLDAAHKTLFLRAVEGLAHDLIRARLRDSATFSLQQHAANTRAMITKALSRQLAPGVQLRGEATGVTARAITTDAQGLVINALVTGTAVVDVK